MAVEGSTQLIFRQMNELSHPTSTAYLTPRDAASGLRVRPLLVCWVFLVLAWHVARPLATWQALQSCWGELLKFHLHSLTVLMQEVICQARMSSDRSRRESYSTNFQLKIPSL